jgi:hypothetical protein
MTHSGNSESSSLRTRSELLTGIAGWLSCSWPCTYYPLKGGNQATREVVAHWFDADADDEPVRRATQVLEAWEVDGRCTPVKQIAQRIVDTYEGIWP